MPKTRRNQAPSEALRHAIAESGLTLYRIAKDTGVVKTSLMRFMRRETSLRFDKVDVLAGYLGLELVMRDDKGKKRSRGQGRGRAKERD
jgi:hypothetical protein